VPQPHEAPTGAGLRHKTFGLRLKPNSKNSAAFATLQKESLWTHEGIQSKKPLVSSKTI
jgi:hypothetical protein